MKRFFILIVLIATGCSNLQDAKPEQRNSFIYFYPNKLNSISNASTLDQDGGVVMVGYRSASLTDLTSPTMVMIKTDARGKIVWQREDYPDSLYGKAIKAVSDGYLVAADRIKVSLDSVTNATTTTFSINFFKMDLLGNIVFQYQSNPDASANYLANAITLDDQNNVVVLATKITGQNNRLAVVYRFASSSSGYTLVARQEVDYQNRNYANGKSVLMTNSGSIIWPSSITNTQTGRSYASFPNLAPGPGPGGAFNTNQTISETDDTNQKTAVDLQKNGFGLAAIGTNYALSSGNATVNNNMFFAKLSNSGGIIPGSIVYYDGGSKIEDPTISTIEDVGVALTPAGDAGFLLVGYLESDPATNRGNGGKDVLLIKVDAFGNVQWTKTYGGAGDEVATTAHSSPDGGFIVTGTSTIQGFASMFMIKTNSDGELNN
jgi:hypothetical protein